MRGQYKGRSGGSGLDKVFGHRNHRICLRQTVGLTFLILLAQSTYSTIHVVDTYFAEPGLKLNDKSNKNGLEVQNFAAALMK